jgi:hypothetical protein
MGMRQWWCGEGKSKLNGGGNETVRLIIVVVKTVLVAHSLSAFCG